MGGVLLGPRLERGGNKSEPLTYGTNKSAVGTKEKTRVRRDAKGGFLTEPVE